MHRCGCTVSTSAPRRSAARVREVIKERLASSDEQTLLVIGLTSPERCSDLVDDLRELLAASPPAAVLFVSGRDEQEVQNVVAPPAYAAAWAL